jgi:hypothetical protein
MQIPRSLRLLVRPAPGEEELGVQLNRRINFVAALVWLAMVPIAFVFGWWESVPFIAACSIYANFASHVAAWRSDVNPSIDRIEAKLDELARTATPP